MQFEGTRLGRAEPGRAALDPSAAALCASGDGSRLGGDVSPRTSDSHSSACSLPLAGVFSVTPRRRPVLQGDLCENEPERLP